ncbi:integrin alpha-L-like, partial [Mustelus asterias]
MTFDPKNIMLKDVDCPKDREGPKVNTKICFAIRQVTKKIAGTPSVNLSYELQLDPRRRIDRAELKSNVRGSFLLRDSLCLEPRIDVKNCLMDFLNPIEVLVKYSGVGQRSGDNPSPVLRSGQNGNYTGK